MLGVGRIDDALFADRAWDSHNRSACAGPISRIQADRLLLDPRSLDTFDLVEQVLGALYPICRGSRRSSRRGWQASAARLPG